MRCSSSSTAGGADLVVCFVVAAPRRRVRRHRRGDCGASSNRTAFLGRSPCVGDRRRPRGRGRAGALGVRGRAPVDPLSCPSRSTRRRPPTGVEITGGPELRSPTRRRSCSCSRIRSRSRSTPSCATSVSALPGRRGRRRARVGLEPAGRQPARARRRGRTSGAVGVLLEHRGGAWACARRRVAGLPSDRSAVHRHPRRGQPRARAGWAAARCSRLQELADDASEDDRELMRHGLHVGLVLDEHRAEFGPGDFLVRNLLGADPNSGALVIGEQVARRPDGAVPRARRRPPPTTTSTRSSPAKRAAGRAPLHVHRARADALRRARPRCRRGARAPRPDTARGRVLRRRDRAGGRPQLPAHVHRQHRPLRSAERLRVRAIRPSSDRAERRRTCTPAQRAPKVGHWVDEGAPRDTVSHRYSPSRPSSSSGPSNVIRGLSMDAVQKANSGHPGTPMALAPLAHVLWTRIMRYDAQAPEWPDRDRFVLSCGHASMLLYSMLYLTGYGLTLEDLEQFRQWGSKTAGHPERGHAAGHRGHDRSARPGHRQRGRPRHRRGEPPRALRARGHRPPRLHVLLRRRLRGRREPRGRVARRPPRPRPARRGVRRQPHHHRRPDRARVHRQRARALRRLRLAGRRARRGRQRPRRARGRGSARRWPTRNRPSLVVLRSHIGCPSPKFTDTPGGPRQPARRGRGPRRQGDPRHAARRALLGARRRARATTGPPAAAAKCEREAWNDAPRGAARLRSRARRRLRRVHRRHRPRGLGGEAPDLERGRAGRDPQGVLRGARRDRRRRPRPRRRRRRPHRQHRHRAQGRGEDRHPPVQGSPAPLRHP